DNERSLPVGAKRTGDAAGAVLRRFGAELPLAAEACGAAAVGDMLRARAAVVRPDAAGRVPQEGRTQVPLSPRRCAMSRSAEPATLEDHFVGSLLGLAVGDALGGCFEGQTPDHIARRFPTPDALLAAPPLETLLYTDDTQMAIGVAEALVEDG